MEKDSNNSWTYILLETDIDVSKLLFPILSDAAPNKSRQMESACYPLGGLDTGHKKRHTSLRWLATLMSAQARNFHIAKKNAGVMRKTFSAYKYGAQE